MASLRQHLAVPMHRDGYALIAGSALTSALGMVYWIVAARRFDPEDVGVAAALITSMGFLANLATLGLRNGLIRFLPRAADPARLIRHAYLWCGLTAIAAATVFLLGQRIWAPDLTMLRAGPWVAVIFVAATVVWLIFVLQDAVLTGIREARWVPVANGLYAVGKLALLLAVTATSAWAIFVTWVAPAALLVIPVNLAALRMLSRRGRTGTEPVRLRPLVRFVGADHTASLLWLATTELVPLVIVITAGSASGATYYMAFTVSYTLYLITSNVSSALVVEASLNPATASKALRRAARQSGMLVAPAALVGIALAPWFLALLGTHYVDSGTGLLRLMLASAVPYVVVGIALGRARAMQRLRLLILVYSAMSASVFAAALLAVPQFGLVAMGWAWLGIQCLLAVVLAPTVFDAGQGYNATILGWAAAVRSAPRRVRRTRAAKDLVRSALGEAGLAGDAQIRLLRSDNDIIVCAARTSETEVLVRVAATPSADATIERSAAILLRMAEDPRSHDWPHAPRLMSLFSVDGRRGSIESLCPGVPVDRLADPVRADAMAAALDVVADFHRATQVRCILDEEWIQRHVDDSIAVIDQALGTDLTTTARLNALRDALHAALAGRSVVACAVHGDLWAGNILIDGTPGAAPTISLIDWEDSVVDGLPDADLAHARLAEQRGEIGPLVRRVLQDPTVWDGAREVDGVIVAGESGLPVRAIVLMAWLGHASGALRRTTQLRPTRRWLTVNVIDVLDDLVQLGTSPRATGR